MSSLEDLCMVDNFYQTFLLFPMPTVIINTLCEDGTTILGFYSPLQPYYVAGKHDIILFLKWTRSHDLVGDTRTGESGFAAYIKDYFGKGSN